MAGYRLGKKLVDDARIAADGLAPSDAALTGVFRAAAAGPVPQKAPPDANNDSYTTNDVTTIAGNVLANDTPGDVPLQVSAVNGNSFAVGVEIILPSGARLRVDADGAFTYNPNNAFNSVPTTDDHFTYSIAGGDSATVTVTVQDPGNPNDGTDNPETITGTAGDDVINAKGGDDTVFGLGGNDVIDGGTGADSLDGGPGDDTFKVDNAGDTIAEADGEGYDVVIASANYTLTAGAHVEELVTAANRATTITLTGNEFNNVLRGGNAADILIGGGGNDQLDGLGSNDSLRGGTGDDVYIVLFGDTITELDGEGNDIAYIAESTQNRGEFTLNAGAYVELIAPLPTLVSQTVYGFQIRGNELDNTLRGGAAGDILRGLGGNDTMIGLGGNDNYFVDQPGDVVVEEAGAGIDTITSSINYTLAEDGNVENLFGTGPTGLTLIGNSGANAMSGTNQGDLIMGHAGNDVLSGASGNDSLYGEDGNDRLDGGTGADLMVGAAGADTYIVDNLSDAVVEDVDEAGQGYFTGDVISTSIDYTLAANQYVEYLSTSGSATLTGNDRAQAIVGGGGANLLFGLGGDDLLYGKGGNDTTDGGFGNDSHYVDDAGDIVVERAGEGRDVVYASVSYTLTAGAEVEVLSTVSLTATSAINLTGNALVQEIYGNAGTNTLNGGGGADLLVGFGGDDAYLITDGHEQVVETAGNGRDVVYASLSYALAAGASIEVLSTASLAATSAIDLAGNELAQEIYGNAGANSLNGGGGSDLLIGLGGDDSYYIVDGSEQILESAGQGRDVVYTAVSYALNGGASIEVLSTNSLAGTAAINLTGNELAQEIYGNAGANTLNGGGGADLLIGLGGDDSYFITSGSEQIIEQAGQGRDVVYAAVSHSLGAGVSIEVLSTTSLAGTAAINLTGNELAQEIYGNNGANILNGGGGADVLVGLGGNDTYYITSGSEQVVESSGNGRDVAYATVNYALGVGVSIEVLSTASLGGTTAIDLTGNELAQEVYGNAGANVLNGGAGNDYLQGFGGADSFAFTTTPSGANVDTIADMVSGTDRILLDDAAFTGLAPGALPAGAFVTGTQAQDADDRIIYDSATGQLFFDADGNGSGAAVLFAILQGAPALNAADFTVI